MTKKRHEILPTAESPIEWQLRERLSELEAENAGLRQLEDTIRRNARLIEALLDKSQDGLTLVTPELRILRSIHSVLGNRDDNLAGLSVLDFIHTEDHVRVQEAFSNLQNNPSQSVMYQCRMRDQDGHWWSMEVEMTDMLDDPDIQAIVLNSRRSTHDQRCEDQKPETTGTCCNCQRDDCGCS